MSGGSLPWPARVSSTSSPGSTPRGTWKVIFSCSRCPSGRLTGTVSTTRRPEAASTWVNLERGPARAPWIEKSRCGFRVV